MKKATEEFFTWIFIGIMPPLTMVPAILFAGLLPGDAVPLLFAAQMLVYFFSGMLAGKLSRGAAVTALFVMILSWMLVYAAIVSIESSQFGGYDFGGALALLAGVFVTALLGATLGARQPLNLVPFAGALVSLLSAALLSSAVSRGPFDLALAVPGASRIEILVISLGPAILACMLLSFIFGLWMPRESWRWGLLFAAPYATLILPSLLLIFMILPGRGSFIFHPGVNNVRFAQADGSAITSWHAAMVYTLSALAAIALLVALGSLAGWAGAEVRTMMGRKKQNE